MPQNVLCILSMHKTFYSGVFSNGSCSFISLASNTLQEKEHAGLVFYLVLTEERHPLAMLALEYNNSELVLFFCVYVCFCF